MARAALGWGVRELAKEADVSANTIFRLENGRNEPNPATLKAIKAAFEAAGVRFEGERGVFAPEEAKEEDVNG
jgi:transcriptional regulator with XRE-family HTH domain